MAAAWPLPGSMPNAALPDQSAAATPLRRRTVQCEPAVPSPANTHPEFRRAAHIRPAAPRCPFGGSRQRSGAAPAFPNPANLLGAPCEPDCGSTRHCADESPSPQTALLPAMPCRWRSATAHARASPEFQGEETDFRREAHPVPEGMPPNPAQPRPSSRRGFVATAATLRPSDCRSRRAAAALLRLDAAAHSAAPCAVGVSPETRRRPVPPVKWVAAR